MVGMDVADTAMSDADFDVVVGLKLLWLEVYNLQVLLL